MGILNVTPDSFFDGGRFNSDKAWLAQTEKMLAEGADIVDVGGFSSRPGCDFVSEDEELRRVLPAVVGLKQRFPDVEISVDTFRAKVAKECIHAGADIINDISGGNIEPEIWNVIAENQHVMYVLMHGMESWETLHCVNNDVTIDVLHNLTSRHCEGDSHCGIDPQPKQSSGHCVLDPQQCSGLLRCARNDGRLHDDDANSEKNKIPHCVRNDAVLYYNSGDNGGVAAIGPTGRNYCQTKVSQLQSKGIDTQRIILDPGFGFGKTIPQNYQLLRNLRTFADMGPVLAGLSRKTMIWKVLGITPEESLHGTMILNMLALLNGATYLRVHDVKEAVATAKLYREYENSDLTNENFY